MPATYEMREMPDVRKKGEQIIYPKMKIQHQVSTDELVEKITAGCTLTPSDLKGAIEAIGKEIARSLADGKSVKIEGIGTFSAKLGLKEGAERETTDKDAPRRNAQSIAVTGINLRVDSKLIQTTDALCELKRGSATGLLTKSDLTKEECLALALEYLASHPYLTVNDYMKLTGKKRSTATNELREFSADKTSGISSSGQASHRIYVKSV